MKALLLVGGKGTLGKLLSEDDKLYNDLAETAESIKSITARMEAGEGTLGKLLSKDDQLYQDLSATMHSLRTVSEKLEKGDGLLGKLITDEEFSKKADELMTEVRDTVDEIRESSPVVTFTSIFFGAF